MESEREREREREKEQSGTDGHVSDAGTVASAESRSAVEIAVLAVAQQHATAAAGDLLCAAATAYACRGHHKLTTETVIVLDSRAACEQRRGRSELLAQVRRQGAMFLGGAGVRPSWQKNRQIACGSPTVSMVGRAPARQNGTVR